MIDARFLILGMIQAEAQRASDGREFQVMAPQQMEQLFSSRLTENPRR
jgi:hypothetical protein